MDKLSFEDRSRNMAKIKGRDTKPEIFVRRLVFSMGFRYRLHRKDLPGTPDLAFIGKKKAIFVHGCFWHRHPGCKRASIPKTNTSKWEKKFNANVLRDKQVQLQLSKMGWQVLVIWQCETKDKDLLNKAIKLFLCEKHD